jgi:hypothetical protein
MIEIDRCPIMPDRLCKDTQKQSWIRKHCHLSCPSVMALDAVPEFCFCRILDIKVCGQALHTLFHIMKRTAGPKSVHMKARGSVRMQSVKNWRIQPLPIFMAPIN